MILNSKQIFQAYKYRSFGILLLIFQLGCAVRQPVEFKPGISNQEFRGIVIPAECWVSSSNDSMKVHVSDILNAVKSANYNALILDLRMPIDFDIAPKAENQINGSGKTDPILWAITEAHRQGLKILVSFDLLGAGQVKGLLNNGNLPNLNAHDIPRPDDSWDLKNNSNTILNPAIPEVKTFLKKMIRNFVMQYDVEGLILDFTPFSDFPEEFSLPDENSPLTGLVEDIVTETMLSKPYLIHGASFMISVMNDHPEINQWMKKGMIDFLMPVIKSIQDPEHPGIIAGWENGTVYSPGEECDKILENLSYLDHKYSEQKKFPGFLKSIKPEQVFSLDVSELLENKKGGEAVEILSDGKMKNTDSEGKIGFILGEKPDTLKIRLAGSTITLATEFWKPPYEYVISEKGEVSRKMPWLEFREMPDPLTTDPEFHLLCKTSWPARAWINEDTVKVYKTGIFFHKISLTEGVNRIQAGVITDDSALTTYTREFTYVKTDQNRSPFPLWIDEKSITPDMNMVLTAEDIVHFSFRGSKGQEGWIRIRPGNREILCSRSDFNDYSLYEADLTLHEWKQLTPHTLSMILLTSGDKKSTSDLEIKTAFTITVIEPSGFPWIRITRDHTRLTYNLGPVRLGGPIRAEYPEGVVLKSSGIFGNFYRIYLNDEEEGYVEMENVEVLPGTYTRSPYYITSLSCSPSDDGDILSIPYDNPIPYAIYPEPALKRIRIRLYGAMTSSTWITHLQGRKYIDQVTWGQITPETYEIQINLSTSRIWGYDLNREGNRLILRIKYPPEINLGKEKPLSGLKIAIEAGHGGESYGAMGLSGLLEKEINLDLAHRFGDLCRSFGAEILQVRETDTTLSLIDKRDNAIHSDADLLISIHANAAGTRRGYLGVGGTSTYYHNPFWADLAESMYGHLVELNLAEFGVIGSFNYTVIRVSQMPSILVEQAFMTQAEDEEKLASPDFRQAMAEKMYEGILEFLHHMKKEQP
jgi:N-acetylmuramoyl-L-alanine amidase